MKPTHTLIQGVDYTLEDGKFVLTRQFLERRGHCCRNGCRHCPYGFRAESRPKDTSEELDGRVES